MRLARWLVFCLLLLAPRAEAAPIFLLNTGGDGSLPIGALEEAVGADLALLSPAFGGLGPLDLLSFGLSVFQDEDGTAVAIVATLPGQAPAPLGAVPAGVLPTNPFGLAPGFLSQTFPIGSVVYTFAVGFAPQGGVPEPGTFVLLATGVVGLWAFGSRRSRYPRSS